ncbi:MAG: hypothetical protein Q8941_12395 [Bacteroidota bacterium]|nr:hypothetical protein [Bacteroidota bacterium]
MTMIALIVGLLVKDKTRPSVFSSAISEGIKDMFTEMGYHFNEPAKS